MKAILPTLIFFLTFHLALGQEDSRPNQQDYALSISKAVDKIKLDGVIEEKTWKEADIASDFWQKSPKDDIKAALKTEMMVSYDDNFFYVAAICHDSTNHVITTLKRDVGFWDGDAVGVVLDPLNQATSGFMFGTSPYGVQTEVLLGGGSGSENYNAQWDNRWFVETKRYQDKWTVEMAIPFKTLRYEAGRSTWGINFIRNDKKNNRIDGWARIPIQFWMI
ncbi:MAG: carbohydrate binding family 9 domain-containing protein, partial [Bacteroidota bacterium]